MAGNDDVNNDIAQSSTADVNTVTQRFSELCIEYQSSDIVPPTEEVPEEVTSDNLYRKLQGICNHLLDTFKGYNEERVYQKALEIELQKLGIEVQSEVSIPIMYNNHPVGTRRADLILTLKSQSEVILELKAVQKVKLEHYNQLLYYMTNFKIEHGFLINFPIKASFPAMDKNRFKIISGELPQASSTKSTPGIDAVQIIEVKPRTS